MFTRWEAGGSTAGSRGKGTNLTDEGSTLTTKQLPKAPPPNTNTLGVRVSAHALWRDTDIQSATPDGEQYPPTFVLRASFASTQRRDLRA